MRLPLNRALTIAATAAVVVAAAAAVFHYLPRPGRPIDRPATTRPAADARPSQPMPPPAGPPAANAQPTPAGNARPAPAAGAMIEWPAGQFAALAEPIERWVQSLTDRLERSVHFHLAVGQLALDADELERARAHFARAIELAPDRAGGYVGLGLVATRAGRFDEALGQFERARVKEPESVDALYNLAVAHSRRREFMQAQPLYERVLELAPGHVRARYNLASIHSYYGRLAEARTTWEQVVAEAPNMASARYNLGLTYLQLTLYDRAIEQFNKLVAANAGDADLWNNLALACQGKGDEAEALRCFRQAYKLRPADPVILNNLADFHLMLYGRDRSQRTHIDEALLLWRKSLSIEPNQQRLTDLVRYYSLTLSPTTQPD